jgi:hypothetical protein
MTESEWALCQEPEKTLEFLRGRASERKLRLFACACCRRVWHLLKNQPSQQAVEAAEQLADGLLSLHELDPVYQAADDAYWDATEDGDESAAAWMALTMLHELPDALQHAIAPDLDNPELGQTSLLRCIVGNPWHPISIDPAVLTWQQGTVVNMAKAIYEERKWEDMPLLGDALEEAGCTDQAVLDHCRGLGPHARGCFVVDAILDRT